MNVANEVQRCVLKSDFSEIKTSFHQLKNQVEDENSQMLGVIRDLKDNFSELSKKFSMALEKIRTDPREQWSSAQHNI